MPARVTVAGDQAVVGLSYPARLVSLDLRDGSTTALSDAPGEQHSSAFLATPNDVFWALPTAGVVRHIDRASGRSRDIHAGCKGSGDIMALVGDELVMTCRNGSRLVQVPLLGDRPVSMLRAGGFPLAVLLDPPSGT